MKKMQDAFILGYVRLRILHYVDRYLLNTQDIIVCGQF